MFVVVPLAFAASRRPRPSIRTPAPRPSNTRALTTTASSCVEFRQDLVLSISFPPFNKWSVFISSDKIQHSSKISALSNFRSFAEECFLFEWIIWVCGSFILFYNL